MPQNVEARAAALCWVATGTALVRAGLAGLDEAAFDAPSALSGWSRRHLAAHLAAHAEALGNLVRWAATGEPTPMYASREQRNADIEAGATRSGPELRERFDATAAQLSAAMAGLAVERWGVEILNAQGRRVSASLLPWMRAREVLVHAADLQTGTHIADLPPEFLRALGDDAVAMRSGGDGPAVTLTASDDDARWTVPGKWPSVAVAGRLGEVVAYLIGRPAALDGPAPALPAWL